MRCRPALPLVLLACVLHVGGARAQVVTDPNQIVGDVRLTNVDLSVLAILGAPGNEGCTQVHAGGSAQPPAPNLIATTAAPAADALGGPYELTVQSDPSGYVYRITGWMDMDGGVDTFKFARQLSTPIFPEPAPDARLDFTECAGIFRFRFLDAASAPVAARAGDVQARRFDPAFGSIAPWSWGPITRGATEETLAAIGDGASWELHAFPTVGSDPFTDLVRLEWSGAADLPCDAIVDVPVSLPLGNGGPGGGGAGRIFGNFDVRGEDEIVLPPTPAAPLGFTVVSATEGPWSNERYAAITTTPASGPWELVNLVPSDVVAPSKAYRVGARCAFRPAFRHEILLPPALEVLVGPGQAIDLGDAFVYDTGVVRGALRLAGPPPTNGLSLLDAVIPPCFAVDGQVPAQCGYMNYGLHVGAAFDGGTAASGATLLDGRAQVMLPFVHDVARDEIIGDYEAVLPSVEGAPTDWRVDTLQLAFDRRTTPDVPESYVDTFPTVTDRRPEARSQVVTPGSSATLDEQLCLSEVQVEFTTTSGTLFAPALSGSGSFAGIDFAGAAADYAIDVSGGANGTPRNLATAAAQGLVVLGLPQGTYTLYPRLTAVSPGGSQSDVSLARFSLDVGCRQVIRAHPDVQVSLTAEVPECATSSPVLVSGRVTSATDVARIAWSVDAGVEVVDCAPCGAAPTFALPIPVSAGRHAILVTATDSDGHVASVTAWTRLVEEPSAIDARPGSEPLRVSRDAAGDLTLTWEPAQDASFNVHRGTIRSLRIDRDSDHDRGLPCLRAQASATLPSPATDAYFLVTAACAGSETSYGRDSLGVERSASAGACP